MEKMIAFHHNKANDMLKFGCVLPNLANIWPHKSTETKIYPFTERNKDLFGKSVEDIVAGGSVVFKRSAVVDETFIRKSASKCKSIVWIDASQLFPCSMCQTRLTGLYTLWDLNPETSRFRPRQNNTRSFEGLVMSYFQPTGQDCKMTSFYTTGRSKKTDCFCVDIFCCQCNTAFEAIGCFYYCPCPCPCRNARPSPTEDNIQRGSQKRARWIETKPNTKKGFTVLERWESEWWRLIKTSNIVKNHIRENSTDRLSFAADYLLEETKNWNLLATFSATLKYWNFWEPVLLTSLHSSRTLQLARMIMWPDENVCRGKRNTV